MRISPDVLNIIARSKTVAWSLYLPEQLDRKTYVSVAKVIEAAGGKWHRASKAHVFATIDAASAIDQLLLTGDVMTRQDTQQFFTPAALAIEVVQRAEIRDGHKVYEPSAGNGALIRAIDIFYRSNGERADVWANEIDPVLQKGLISEFFHYFGGGGCGCGDFLAKEPIPTFDRIVMNPPFAKQADITHVMHALRFLKPGGRLVSIMSSAARFRDNPLALNFRSMIENCGGSFIDLPAGSFKESGTMVNTVLLTVDNCPCRN